jgi:hypothetical protein
MICQSNSHVSRLRWRSLSDIPYEPSAAAADPEGFPSSEALES